MSSERVVSYIKITLRFLFKICRIGTYILFTALTFMLLFWGGKCSMVKPIEGDPLIDTHIIIHFFGYGSLITGFIFLTLLFIALKK